MADSVDVILLTKNSERMLEECVESVYGNVPVGQMIVVDGYSQDKTVQILKKFDEKYHNVKFIFDQGNRATARQKGIKAVKSEWFMFVDSDVVLCKDWYKKAQTHLAANIGSVWGIEIWSTIQNQKTLKLFLVITRKVFEIRGGTHDTLIRSDLMKDIKIPNNLHVFEDAYIKNWIINKGYDVKPLYNPFCIHFRPPTVWTLRGSSGLVAEAFRFGNPRMIARLLVAYGFYAAYSVYQLLVR